jgi:DNA-binding ferritin-like protein
MRLVQRSVIFHYNLKGHGYKQIHTKLVASYG